MDAYYADEARRRVQQYRDSQFDDKSSSRRTSRSKDEPDFTYKEVNPVLEEVVEEGGPVGIIEALLALGGDVNLSRRKSSNVWKKISNKNQQPQRSDILLRAVTKGRPDVVSTLAAHADQENLDSVLPTAITKADFEVVKILIGYGANPEELHEEFENVVLRDQVDVAAALVAGPKKPCTQCRSAGLCAAVKNGSLDMMEVLVKSGADVNYDNARALLGATDSWRPDYIATLVSGPVPPLPGSLDLTVGRTLQIMRDTDSKQGSTIIELCIRAGASGPKTERLLTNGIPEAVGHRQLSLLDTILKFRAPSGQNEALALSEAVRTEQQPAIDKLLKYHPHTASLISAVAQAMQLSDTDSRYEIMQLLVKGGARKICLSGALVQVVGWLITDIQYGGGPAELTNRSLFSLILNDGEADVDHNAGEALQMAIKASCTDIVWEIVSRQPSPRTIGAALPLAIQVEDQEQKEILVDMLMKQRVEEKIVNEALVESVRGGPDNLTITESLLTWASVNFNEGEVFALAIRNMDLNTLRTLLARKPSSQSLHTAVQAANDTVQSDRYLLFDDLLEHLNRDHLNVALKHTVFESEPDLELASFLLQNGASATQEDGICIKHAATILNLDLLRILSEYGGHDEAIYTDAFSDLMQTGRDWISLDHVELVELLLKHGASGDVVNRALIDVVDHLGGDESTRDLTDRLVNKLIAADADVNFQEGEVITKAAERGDSHLLRRMLSQNASSETSTRAFSVAITSGHSEDLLLEMIDVFAEEESTRPEINRPEPGMLPPVYLCLEAYPDSVPLLEHLVVLGCDLESTVPCQVYTTEPNDEDPQRGNFGVEPVTVLTWALLHQEIMFDMAILVTMVELGANVSYATPESQTTPLIIAAKRSHLDAVELLLEAQAKPSAKDKFGRSALFYASRSGDVQIVATLLNSKPSTNDGSLHEAARSFHAPVMELVLKAGHDADYRSTKHGGRTALGEMALKGRVSEDVARTEEAVDLLKDAAADPMIKVDGKSVIFLALDNTNPEPVVRVLLDRILWKTLNDEGNIYQERNHYYSPSMYLKKGISNGPVSPKFVQALKDHGAIDRYYASMEHTQPYDAVGLPADIAEFEKLRRTREIRLQREEEEHEIHQRRENELAANKVRNADLQHHTRVRHGDELANQTMRNRRLEHSQDIKLDVEKHNLNVAKQYANADVQSKTKWMKHQDDTAIRKEVYSNDRDRKWTTHQDNQAMRAETRETDRQHKWLTHQDSRDMRLENRTADRDHRLLTEADDATMLANRRAASREHKLLTHADDSTIRAERRTADVEHKRLLYQETRQQRLLTHQDTTTMRSETRAADLEHKRLAYEDTRQQRLLTHQDNTTIKSETRAADLEQTRLLHTQKLSSMSERKQLEAAHRDQQHEQDLAHRQAFFQQRAAHIQTTGQIHLQIRGAKHVQQMDHTAERRAQKALEQDQKRNHQRLLDAQKREHKLLTNQATLDHSRSRDAQTVETRRLLAKQSHEAGEAKVGQLQRVHQMQMAQMDSQRMNMAGQANLREWQAWKAGQGQGGGRAVQGTARKTIQGPEVEEMD